MITSTLTLCRSTARQISCGSNRGTSTTVSPLNKPASAATWALPWMSGAAHSLTRAPPCPRRDCSHSSASGVPVAKSIPPARVRQMSSWRHMTPFG